MTSGVTIALVAGVGSLGAMIADAGGQSRGASPIPPPSYQETADCRQPSYAIDQLVCADPALRALDSALTNRLEVARAQGGLPTSRFVEDQGAWLRRRSLCAFQQDRRGCTEAAYRMRLIEVTTLTGDGSHGALATCSDGLGAVTIASGDGDSRALSTPDGRPLLVAFSRRSVSWTPFAAYIGTATSLTMKMVGDGTTVKCRIQGTRR